MNKTFFKNPIYLGIATFFITLILMLLLYFVVKYETDIEKDMFTISTSDVLSITNNKAKHVQHFLSKSDDYIKDIKEDINLQKQIEETIKDLRTNNINYIYLLYKDKNDIFRFLVDASLGEKAMLNQKFDVDSSKWFELYKTKKPIIIQHTILKKLSISYLVPILEKNEVSLVLVIDFSVKKVENINKILDLMKKGLILMIIIISIFLILFIIQIIRYKKIKRSSITDKLTNVYNRNYLHEIQDDINLDDYIIELF